MSGDSPKVGIRPIIDGRRRGVRESLEEQTLAMARNTAAMLSKNVRLPDGSKLECVVPERCIGGVAEAAAVSEQFQKAGVKVLLSVTPCWCYGLETIDMDFLLPQAVWGFNGTERPGAVYLAAVLAGHNQAGIPAFGIYGKDVQDSGDSEIPEDVKEKLLRFVRAGLAVAQMRGRSYLALGGVSMGIAGSALDHSFFNSYLGMRVESVDMTELIRRIDEGIYDKEEFKHAMEWVDDNCKEGKDYNPEGRRLSKERKEEDWKVVVKMTLIAKDMMVGNPKLADAGFGEEALGHNAIAGGFQGQRAWTDHFPNGDFMEAILNTSFDWNGLRQPFVFATENDSLNAVAMLFGHLLTNTAQMFSDVRTYWSPSAVERVAGYKLEGKASGGIIHLINSGSTALDATGLCNGKMKPFWDIEAKEAEACLKATKWYPAILEYFRGGGFSSGFRTVAEMPVTMSRVNLVKGLGPVLQIAQGHTVVLPEKVSAVLEERTNPTWPTTWFVPELTGNGPFRDVYSVMNTWGANHGAINYGHIGADLIALAALLRIPVYMHNVAEEKIFRPSYWSLFGTNDPEGADFRACNVLGPLY